MATSPTSPGRKRDRRSQISRHPDRLLIELHSLAGMSLDRISTRFGVHRDSIWRHMKTLDPAYRAALVADVPLEEMAQRAASEGLSLLDQLAVLRQSLMHAAIEAKASGNHYAHATLSNAAVKAIHEAGRISGELRGAPTIQNITNNVAVVMASPAMQRLKSVILQSLAPHPEALAAVVDALAAMEAAPPEPEHVMGLIDARAA